MDRAKRIGFGCIGWECTRQAVLDWNGLNWSELDLIELDCNGCTGVDWTDVVRTGVYLTSTNDSSSIS